MSFLETQLGFSPTAAWDLDHWAFSPVMCTYSSSVLNEFQESFMYIMIIKFHMYTQIILLLVFFLSDTQFSLLFFLSLIKFQETKRIIKNYFPCFLLIKICPLCFLFTSELPRSFMICELSGILMQESPTTFCEFLMNIKTFWQSNLEIKAQPVLPLPYIGYSSFLVDLIT